ncbi:12853_t:CDS:2 [Ambispora leptoticha]|uniref:12853_t:CDS:1 n=1 Tax=Ambispora leptoticha TaxID=144679 RepID=A0A9N9ERM3_9GLOM|nr:12853_t:CDS:2 [Ambispora leptoticha]
MAQELRSDVIHRVLDESKFVPECQDSIEKSCGCVKYIESNSELTDAEKERAKLLIYMNKDIENLIRIKGSTYPCKVCNKSGYTMLNCEHCMRSCLKRQFSNWTSGNDIIDKMIQDAQMTLPTPRGFTEWIPFSDFEQVAYKTRGGFGEIFTAIWMKGYAKAFDQEKQEYIRSGPFKVILKVLSKSNKPNENFLKELQTHLTLTSNANMIVPCLGVSRRPESDDYILVLKEMKYDLRSYIQENFKTLTWQDLYHVFRYICNTLRRFHQANIVHRDLHSGNVLKRFGGWYIADLGLCGPADKTEKDVFGILPYIAPEVLRDNKYTPEADIYSVGMLMYECCTGKLPFYDYNCDNVLAICAGMRPPIPEGLPESYVKMMKRCWADNPSMRPTAVEAWEFFGQQIQKLEPMELVFKDPIYISDRPLSRVYQFSNLLNSREDYDFNINLDEINGNESFSSFFQESLQIHDESIPVK